MKKHDISWRNRKQVLSDFIKENKLQIVAEIGVWQGALSEHLLANCSDVVMEYWAIDLWKENYGSQTYQKISGDSMWNSVYLNVCNLMIPYSQLHVIRASSLDATELFPLSYFDLVFIDADHRYEAVLADIKSWLPLVKKGGFLTGHDYGGRKGGVTRAVDDYFGKDKITVIDGIWIKEIDEKL